MLGDYLKILADYGFLGIVIITAVLLLYKYITARFDLWLLKRKKKEIDSLTLNEEMDLKYHAFFFNAQYWLLVEIPNLKFNPRQPVRQQLFRDLLYRKIKTLHENFHKSISEDMSEWSSDQWANEMTMMLSEMTVEFENKAKKDEIPEKVIEIFNRWYAPTLKIIHDHISSLANSKMYDTNLARMNTLLLIMNLMVVTMIGDAERALTELNGEISGLEYRNLPIE